MMQTSIEILLVEDNEGDVEMTQRAFRDREGACNISVADNGRVAIDFLHKKENFAGAPTPHLILLDLNMPCLDGKGFLETIKQESQFKAIPVVVLTSSQSPADIRDCYERHASVYVVKPFDAIEYMDIVRKIICFWRTIGQLPSSRTSIS
jgi:two-component system, chemotaxis family, response regulator Rcp1